MPNHKQKTVIERVEVKLQSDVNNSGFPQKQRWRSVEKVNDVFIYLNFQVRIKNNDYLRWKAILYQNFNAKVQRYAYKKKIGTIILKMCSCDREQ